MGRGEASQSAPAGTALRRHEAGLDGLRAVAIGVVLLYHGEVPAARGGFLGISLFFTLSGFLITALLLRSHAAIQRIDLRSFWGRRYRRLLPAAYLTLAFVVLFGATVATRQQLSDLPQAVVSCIFQVANWFFIYAGQSYVHLFTAPSPVQHFWSLAIEEQFYLVMPLVLILLLRRTRSMRVVAAVLAGAAVLSTVEMAFLYQRGASLDRLYYGTDTRAAELLVGCVLAVVLSRRPITPTATAPGVRRAWGGAGLAAAVVTVWGFSHYELTNATLWRGGFLVFALLSAVLIVSVLHHAGPVAWLLGTRPLGWVGRISYGLYLFHWPVFLWLDEARTGLSLWPLLVLRVAVTTALALASFHLLEMPVRNRSIRITPAHLRWVAAGSALAIVVGTAVVATRNVPEQFGGLESAVGAAPTPRVDRHLDVLVITDAIGRPHAEALRRRAAGRSDLSVTVAPEFGCTGLTGAGPDAICRNWLTDWPKLVRSVDPDVVLFHVTDWDPAEIGRLSGRDDPPGQTAWARSVLAKGLGLLDDRGAAVAWSYEPPTGATITTTTHPFFQAMDLVTVDSGVLRLQETSDVAEALTQVRALRRPSDRGLPRVMVVGDSSSRTFGYGLEHWATASGKAVVWSVGTGGCGIADDGQVVDLGRVVPVAERCRAVQAGWRSRIAQFRPDLVVVMSSIYDNQQRQLPGWPRMEVPGDAAFDDYLVRTYASAYDTLSAHGAKVLWMKNPCARPSAVGPWPRDARGGPLATDRIRHVNDVVLPRVVAARPALRTFDLFPILCPHGTFVDEIGGVPDFRPDGIHYSPAASIWLAGHYGSKIVAAGLR